MYITGDKHGKIDLEFLSDEKWQDQNSLTKDDYLIIAGDFGGVWYGDDRDNEVLDYHASKPYTTLFIDGNHENFDALRKYPLEAWNGGMVRKIRPDIIHLERGYVFTIKDKKIFTFGGAGSIDKAFRTPHVSWWKEEIPSTTEISRGMQSLLDSSNEVDIVVTHEAPRSIIENELGYQVGDGEDEFVDFLEYVKVNVSYDRWFFGHHHVDRDYGKLQLLYDRVIEI